MLTVDKARLVYKASFPLYWCAICNSPGAYIDPDSQGSFNRTYLVMVEHLVMNNIDTSGVLLLLCDLD